MSQTLNLKLRGLFTNFNEFSEVPEGALLKADNIDLVQDSIAQPRRGFDRETAGYSNIANRTDALVEYQNHKIAHHGTFGSANTLSYYTGSAWTSLETISAPTSRKMKFVGAGQNLYYTSSSGIRVLGTYNGSPRAAGAPKGLDITASTSASSSTFLATTYSVAYRAVWVYKDANKNFIYGAPSQREIYTNSSGSDKAVDLVVTIPATITTSWFLQIYRSSAIVGTPNDELYLVYEASPTSGEISAKSMTITDIVPDSLTGATLYTSASQEGIAMSNEGIPLVEDMAYFDGCVFGFNCTSKHRFYVTLLSVGGSAGIAANDTITVGGITYTGKASETAASAQFLVETGGGYTAAQKIERTAQSLVRVINRYASSTVYAYYISGVDDLPGQMLFEERSIGGAAFNITSSRATCWTPTNIPTSGTTIASENDAFANQLKWSKPDQSEAWPLPNAAFVGSKNDTGMRCIALYNALYMFNQSGQVYKLTGSYPNYQIDKIEDSVRLLARDSAKVLNNQIYCLTDQGVVVLGDSTKVISRPIEQDLLSIVNSTYSTIDNIAFGASYESERKYYIFLPTLSGDTYATQAYVYNTFTNSWVRHTISSTCSIVDHLGIFYLADAASNFLLKERKNYSFLDYADYGFAASILTVSSGVVTISSGFDEVAVGDLLFQSTSIFAQVLSLDPSTESITVDSDPGLTVAAVTILKGIPVEIQWVPITMGNPSIQKHFNTVSLLFKSDFIGVADLSFVTDLQQSSQVVPLQGRGLGIWGLFTWGEEAWGGESYKRPLPQWVPRSCQRASQITVSFSHTWAYSSWILQGMAVFGELGSEKVGRS